jgi:integrase
MNTKVYIDTRRREQNGYCPVRIMIHAGSQAACITVENIRVLPESWDGSRVVGVPNANAISTKISMAKAEIDKALFVLEKQLAGLTATQIKQRVLAYLSPDTNGVLLYDMIMDYAKKVKPGTAKVYLYSANHIKAFDAAVLISDVDRKWLESFDLWLMRRGLGINSRSIIMRNIRTVYNEALDDGLVTNYPFRKFKIKQEQTEKRSLTLDELATLYNVEVDEWQRIYVDYFFLCFFLCGINLVDLAGLTDDDYHSGRIRYRRAKTGHLYSIKVEPEAQLLIEKYKGRDGHLLDILDRYKNYQDFAHHMNNGLHKVGMDCRPGCRQVGRPLFPKISQYWCRHTWATLAYELGIPMEVIAQGLGHSYGSKTTSVYIRPNQQKADDANRKVIDALIQHKSTSR